ncbi:MAG: hypothetical protein J6T01_06965 [Kiritimatiellae bacterium]|nr:hypothetical protein [Kiritimatiellia bacterium]
MKKGSALLIVLGMMAFMVVSAVAFSMFMRQSRLPSSFLRQRIGAAQLVKAGLAGAMREIDAAIGDDPYPGVGNRSGHNYWRNRVFMGDEESFNMSADDERKEPTVSTLALESIAYIPPPLVNTVRYWSRRTRTAVWAPLGYDAGRYAYTAVNVSDYFDINRFRANIMRDSSPNGRISIAYLFENTGHTGDGTVSPDAFDQFISKTTNDAFRTRLVSMADYNLAIGSGVYGSVGFISPFWNYIASPPRDGSFYGSGAELAKAQKFITDSWFPGAFTNGTAVLLTDDADGQPLVGKDESLDDLQTIQGNSAFKILRERLDLCTLGALYDYIDEDSVPISLAIPTMEHVPMLTGIEIVPENIHLELDHKDKAFTKQNGEEDEKWNRRTWFVKSVGTGARVVFNAVLAYPFKRTSNVSRKSSYEVQVLVQAFLAKGSDPFDKTRLVTGFKPGKGDWKAANAMPTKGYFTLFGRRNVSVSEGVDENHCAIDLTGLDLEIDSGMFANAVVYGIAYKEDDKANTAVYDATDFAQTGSGKKLRYRDISGRNGAEVADNMTLNFNFAVWVRVMDGNDTVDLVPAVLADDREYNGHDSGDFDDNSKICGGGEPVIPLACGTALKLDLGIFRDKNGAQDAVAPGGLSIYCDDPRFNYAPEDWYLAQNGVRASDWLATAQDRCNGSGRRQNDIFQFVSDEGFLQSMGELQFLPYIRSFNQRGNPFEGGFFNAGKYDGAPFASRQNAAACVNRDYAWKTHYAFGEWADGKDGFDADPCNWGILDSSGGLAVSPFAGEDLLMAAFANTPYDWIIASPNDKMNLAEGRKYCFGPASSEAKVEWDELRKFAKGFKSAIGSNPNWETAYANEWDDENPFGANFGDNFHDVDRKYLYSFWKNCLANRQQLFLIFVRAEPTVMGGSNAGHTPSQLGARAVALVWREPVSSVNETTAGTASPPHRMRILFYHQFD